MPQLEPPPLSVLGITLESLDPTQRARLDEMREVFKNVDYLEKHYTRPSLYALNDYVLFKYLRAADFDVNKASSMLKKNIEWRSLVKPEELSWENPSLRKETKVMGKSKQGHPVLFCKMSHWRPLEYTDDSYMKSRTLEMEEARREMARDGWRVDRIIVINDMRGFSFFEHATAHAFKLSKVLMAFFGMAYLESVETIYLLNAPIVFQSFWTLVKRFTNHDVLQRIKFVNDSGVLLEVIDEDQLYEGYGGTKQWDYYD